MLIKVAHQRSVKTQKIFQLWISRTSNPRERSSRSHNRKGQLMNRRRIKNTFNRKCRFRITTGTNKISEKRDPIQVKEINNWLGG